MLRVNILYLSVYSVSKYASMTGIPRMTDYTLSLFVSVCIRIGSSLTNKTLFLFLFDVFPRVSSRCTTSRYPKVVYLVTPWVKSVFFVLFFVCLFWTYFVSSYIVTVRIPLTISKSFQLYILHSQHPLLQSYNLFPIKYLQSFMPHPLKNSVSLIDVFLIENFFIMCSHKTEPNFLKVRHLFPSNKVSDNILRSTLEKSQIQLCQRYPYLLRWLNSKITWISILWIYISWVNMKSHSNIFWGTCRNQGILFISPRTPETNR